MARIADNTITRTGNYGGAKSQTRLPSVSAHFNTNGAAYERAANLLEIPKQRANELARRRIGEANDRARAIGNAAEGLGALAQMVNRALEVRAQNEARELESSLIETMERGTRGNIDPTTGDIIKGSFETPYRAPDATQAGDKGESASQSTAAIFAKWQDDNKIGDRLARNPRLRDLLQGRITETQGRYMRIAQGIDARQIEAARRATDARAAAAREMQVTAAWMRARQEPGNAAAAEDYASLAALNAEEQVIATHMFDDVFTENGREAAEKRTRPLEEGDFKSAEDFKTYDTMRRGAMDEMRVKCALGDLAAAAGDEDDERAEALIKSVESRFGILGEDGTPRERAELTITAAGIKDRAAAARDERAREKRRRDTENYENAADAIRLYGLTIAEGNAEKTAETRRAAIASAELFPDGTLQRAKLKEQIRNADGALFAQNYLRIKESNATHTMLTSGADFLEKEAVKSLADFRDALPPEQSELRRRITSDIEEIEKGIGKQRAAEEKEAIAAQKEAANAQNSIARAIVLSGITADGKPIATKAWQSSLQKAFITGIISESDFRGGLKRASEGYIYDENTTRGIKTVIESLVGEKSAAKVFAMFDPANDYKPTKDYKEGTTFRENWENIAGAKRTRLEAATIGKIIEAYPVWQAWTENAKLQDPQNFARAVSFERWVGDFLADDEDYKTLTNEKIKANLESNLTWLREMNARAREKLIRTGEKVEYFKPER